MRACSVDVGVWSVVLQNIILPRKEPAPGRVLSPIQSDFPEYSRSTAASSSPLQGMQVPAHVLWGGMHGKPRASPGFASLGAWGHLVDFSSMCLGRPLQHVAGGSRASVLPELCNLLYSIGHIFVHRYILNSWGFLLRYSVFYRTIFIILERSYLSFLF